LVLRSVSVTRAFDPSPPLRQYCDEILSPSRGDISMGVIAPAGVVSGLSKDGMSCPPSVDNGADSVTAAATARRTGSLFEVCGVLLADPGSSIHAPARIRMAAGSQISLGWKYLTAAFSGHREKLPMVSASLESPVISTRYSPVSIAMPSTDGERLSPCQQGQNRASVQPRLPMARFRRCFINWRNLKWFPPDNKIEAAAVGSDRALRGWPCGNPTAKIERCAILCGDQRGASRQAALRARGGDRRCR
jgi:hypothetical protein